jgi:AcrR family transcriptional regulator
MTPVRSIPAAPPTPRVALTIPIAVITFSRGNTSRIVPMASGITAVETPCSARPAISTPSEPATAQSSDPATSSAMASTSIFFLPYMSPSRDSSGVATAPASSVAVNTHVTADTDVWNAPISRGSSGSTSVCMTDTTRPAMARAASVSRADDDVACWAATSALTVSAIARSPSSCTGHCCPVATACSITTMPASRPATAAPGTGARRNLGPRAAAQNRSALVAAAREVFGTAGYDAPLSAVARRAGVGQGSLYRHFPDRVSLALAAFDDNVSQLEALAARPDSTLDDCLDLLTEQVITAAAFIDMLSGLTGDPRVAVVTERVTAVLAAKLPEAQRTGRYGPGLQSRDLLLAVGMMSTLIARTPPADRQATADRAWALLRRALSA